MWALVKALGKSQLKSGKTSVLKSRCRGWAVAQAEWRSGVCCGAGGVAVGHALAHAVAVPHAAGPLALVGTFERAQESTA